MAVSRDAATAMIALFRPRSDRGASLTPTHAGQVADEPGASRKVDLMTGHCLSTPATRVSALETADIVRTQRNRAVMKGRVMRMLELGSPPGRQLRGDLAAVIQPAEFWNGDNATG